MQDITASLESTLKNAAQRVEPFVEAQWVSGRTLSNVKGYSSSDDYVEFVKEQNPVFYTRFNESFDVLENMYTGVKPVSHWRMNNASNTLAESTNQYIVQDECGYNNLRIYGVQGSDYAFQQTGVVQDNNGALSTGISFNAVNAYGASVQKDTQNRWTIVDNPTFSVECWIKPTNINNTDGNFILYKDSKGYLRSLETGAIMLSLPVPEWTLNIDKFKPKFTIYNSNTGYWKPLDNKSNIYVDVTGANNLTAGNWYHIVVTFDGKTLSLYVNNVLEGSNNVLNGNLLDTTSGSLYVGARYFSWTSPPGVDTLSPDTRYNGLIDELAIYNSCLTMADIKQRWKTGSLNIGAANRSAGDNHNHLIDYSGKGRNAFIYNPASAGSAFTGIDFRSKINGSLATPFNGRKDCASAYFDNGTSIINYQHLTSDNSATGTSVFDGSAKLTVSGWMYIQDKTVASESIEMIAAFGTSSGDFHTTATVSNGSWYLTLRRQTNGNVNLSGSIYNGTGSSPIVTAPNIPRNTWIHFVFSINASNQAIIMINGDPTLVAVSATSTTTMNTNSQWKLFIGGRQSNEGLTKCFLSEISILNTNADLRAWSAVYQSVISSNNLKGVNKFYDPLQVVNGQNEHTLTWAVLDSLDENGDIITANGGYYISEREETLQITDYEYGWWSKAKSNGSGNFTTPQKLYLSFNPVLASHIDLYSSTKYGRIKDVIIRYRSADDGVWSAVTASLTSSSYIVTLPATIDIDALELTINSTLYPNDVARVQEFAPRWTEDISNRIVSLDLSKTRENYDSSVPLGATGANTCGLVLDNTDLVLNPENTGSPYYGLMTPGVKFNVGYNFYTSSGVETITQGSFYSDNWGIDSNNMTVSVSCRDFSGKMQDSTVVDGYLASDVTAGEAIGELALRAGVPLSKLDIDKNYVSTVLDDKPAAFWRLNETTMEQKSLYFNGSTYLYSHPFADLMMGQSYGGTSVPGTKKNTTIASKKVLPKTFYDFPSSACTIEFWVKCGSTARGKTIFNYATKRFANELRVSVGAASPNASEAGKIITKVQSFAPGAAEPADSTGVISTTAIDDNIWHHIAIVIDPAVSAIANGVRVQYYIDGSADVAADIANFSLFRPSGQALIGAGFTAGGISANIATGPHIINTSSLFIGSMREFKVWSTPRTQAQIWKNINYPYGQQKINAHSSYVYKNLVLSDNPVAYWPLDAGINANNTTNFIRDISGYDRNGTQSGATISSATGPIKNEDDSRSLYFGGSSSSINISNTIITPFEGTSNSIASSPVVSQYDLNVFQPLTTVGEFTLEFWIRPSAVPGSRKCIISKYDGNNATISEWRASLTTDMKIQFEIFNTSRVALVNLASSNVVVQDQWSHVAIVISGSKIQTIINGEFSGQAFLATGTYATNLNATLKIGNEDLSPSVLACSLAHIAIYKRALSLDDIYSHYSKAGYGDQNVAYESTGRLLCHWPMNQGRFYAYEDLNTSGFAYTSAGRRKENIVPNVTKFSNHLFAYTSNTTSNPVNQSMWPVAGAMAAKDSAGVNYASYRLGTSPSYDEFNTSNYITYNVSSPISSEVEKSLYLNNTTSTVKNLLYMNYMSDVPLLADVNNSFTIEMWMKPINVTHKQYLFSRENFTTTVEAGTWRIFLDTDGVVKFEIFRFDNSAAYSITPTGLRSSLVANQWYHIGCTFIRSGGNYVMTIYINGVEYAVYSWSATLVPLTERYVKTILGAHGGNSANAFIGSLSNIAIYNYKLSNTTLLKHYTRGSSLYQQVYPSIGAAGDSYWAEMLRIATADIGMFYFDENNNFVYEHGRSYDDAIDVQHSEVQYEINDGNLISVSSAVPYNINGTVRTYNGLFPVSGTVSYGQYGGASSSTSAIISGSQAVELQVNKVVVKVYPPLTTSIGKTSIWSADSGTSLAICTLASNISATSTDSIPLTLTLNTAGIYEPVWPEGGVVKIDNEFIRYKKTSGNTLFDLERGYWNSTPQNHAAGATVGEAREFNLEWSSSPVFFVSYPFITGVIYDKTIVASNWKFNGLNGYIRLHPSPNAVASNKYIVVEGNNPVTKLDNFFHVAGIVMSNQEKNKQSITEISEDYKDNIRRYGEKTLEIDNPLIQDAQYAKDMAQYLLQKYALPVPILEVSTMGLPQLQLGDRIKINTFDRLSILNGEYWIMAISMSYNGGIDQKMTLRKVS